MAFNKIDLINLLTSNEVRLTYTSKQTGETSVIRASLRSDDIPPTTTTARDSEDQIVVFNLDKRQWRSLVVNNVKSAEVVG